MSHGGLPARRPDQIVAATPRTVQPGQRAQQVTNSKTQPLTVQIINKPGDPVIVQDGGVLDCLSIQGYATDGGSTILLPSVGGQYQLWFLTISSFVGTASGTGVVQTDDFVQLTGSDAGQVIGAVVNGIAGTTGFSVVAAEFDLKGLQIGPSSGVELVNGSTGYTHRTSAVLQYTV